MGSKKQWRLQHSIWYVNGNWMASKCRKIHIFKGKILEKLSKCIKLPSPNKGLFYQGPPLCVLFGYVRTSEIPRIDVAPPTWNLDPETLSAKALQIQFQPFQVGRQAMPEVLMRAAGGAGGALQIPHISLRILPDIPISKLGFYDPIFSTKKF